MWYWINHFLSQSCRYKYQYSCYMYSYSWMLMLWICLHDFYSSPTTFKWIFLTETAMFTVLLTMHIIEVGILFFYQIINFLTHLQKLSISTYFLIFKNAWHTLFFYFFKTCLKLYLNAQVWNLRPVLHICILTE